MLQPYLDSINSAVLFFPFAAALFTFPFLIVQYRRHGYVNKWRGFLLYLFLLYLICAYFLVLLPFPDSRHNAAPTGSGIQLLPFQFVQDIVREAEVVPGNPSTYVNVLTNFAFLQVVFNVLLTLPFGLFVRYYFRAGLVACLLASFALSALFETTQLTAVFGWFDYPYRVFDVDDLIANTTGGMLGAAAAGVFTRKLPQMDKLDEDLDLSEKKVTYLRRFVAFAIDYFIWNIPINMLTAWTDVPTPISYLVITGLYFLLIPYWTGGFTPGKWLVRMRIAGPDGEPPNLRETFVRGALLYWALGGLQILPGLFGSDWIGIAVLMVMLIVNATFAVHLLIRVFGRKKRLFYETMSKTKQRIA
ncbi:VanZ family protein [Saccharibacillus sacchari]|uniref:VanZ family protein n=1 Tax=Saccharibacillus sacchari TaxID=456493 RepID=A0ACC6P8X8_9BACL